MRHLSWLLGPVGALVSRSGQEMASTAILLFAYVVGAEGGLLVGVMSVLAAVGGPLLGVALDRARSRAPFVLSLLAFAVALALLGTTIGSGAPLVAVALAALAGVVSPAVSAGWSTHLTSADPERSRRLTVLDAGSYSVAALAGPALAGGIYVLGGEAVALGVAVALVAAGALFAPLVPVPPKPPLEGPQPHPLRDIAAGLAAIGRNPRLRSATVASCVAFAGFGMLLVAVPALGEERFGEPGQGPLLLVVVAIAALVANAVVDRLRALRAPHLLLAGAIATTGLGLGILAPHLSPVVAVVAAVLIGLGDGPQLSSIIHIRHLEAPPRLRAQVFTTGASIKIAASGLGSLLAAAVEDFGTLAVLVIAAALHLVAAVIAAASGERRAKD